MKLRYRIALLGAIVVAVAVSSLALVLSHDSPCAPAPPVSGQHGLMKAVVHRCYGSPAVLRLEDVDRPVPRENELLVQVRAAAVNPLDWHYMRGTPYIMRLGTGIGRPDDSRLGVDYAGTVEAVGEKVTRFEPGDEVFGGRNGALAEYLTVRDDRAVARKPENVTFGEAAGVAIAATTALQGLRDGGRLQAGQSVLINGASGGVGTFAVQIAKAFGARVTGVCSTRNVDMVLALGADEVIDYTKEDFTSGERRFDVILDNVGNRPLLQIRRVLKPDGRYVLIGGGGRDAGLWIGPMVGPVKAMVLSWFVSQHMGMLLAELNQADLSVLADLMAAGKLRPVIDRRYPLSDVPAAIEYLEQGHARGKVVIDVQP